MIRSSMLMHAVTALIAVGGCAAGDEMVAVNGARGTPHRVADDADVHARLAPYGRWFDYAGYGECWSPHVSSAAWRPYADGYWAYSDFGWTWFSNEPWGWATYHYGRWQLDPYHGWIWVPGDEWAPAWVAWRTNEEWVGWAPLPPEASWSARAGLRFASADRIPARQWSFVRRGRLGARDMRRELEPTARAVRLMERTRDATRYGSTGGRPLDRGPAIENFERGTNRPIRRVSIRAKDLPQTRVRPHEKNGRAPGAVRERGAKRERARGHG